MRRHDAKALSDAPRAASLLGVDHFAHDVVGRHQAKGSAVRTVVAVVAATAMVAATSGDVTHFVDARHFASWFGLTPKEHSSGSSRHLGRISKRGDRYLRMLLTHGARSVLRAASVARERERPGDGLRTWALGVQSRSNHNKATCALANKLARICYACLRDGEPYGAPPRPEKKLNRTAYALPA